MALIDGATARGQRGMARYGQYTLARVEISGGRFDAALAVAVAATEDDAAFATELILPELVEAAMRTGRRDLALATCATLSARAQAAGTHWGLGLAACARGLISDGTDAEDAYRQAIDHLARTQSLVDLARTHLLFGEWLRRAKRRTDARHHLAIAHEMFLGMGADGFAAQAGAGLEATGARARRHTRATSLDLTPQEARVADLATEGASNNEIAAQLFLSASTVEYHLKKVFRKLNVTSRTQLARRCWNTSNSCPLADTAPPFRTSSDRLHDGSLVCRRSSAKPRGPEAPHGSIEPEERTPHPLLIWKLLAVVSGR